MTVQLMSDGELGRLEVLRDLDQRRLTTAAAAQLLGLERRQVFRLLRRYRAEGAAGLISKRRGRPGNRGKPEEFRTKALAIIRERYWDFGPTLAAEKLGELHGIVLGRETLRLWMIEAGLWLDRKQRLKRVHQPRHRRECAGELVQVDGCEHWWFEDRGPQCTLLVFIDDATSRLMHLRFVESESTFAYFHATRAYLEAWGKPVALYSDKHGVFRVNQTGALGGDGMTQFGRALDALNIDIICANSSQAKGRVERAHKTLQDRLVKELRLAGASSLAEGTAGCRSATRASSWPIAPSTSCARSRRARLSRTSGSAPLSPSSASSRSNGRRRVARRRHAAAINATLVCSRSAEIFPTSRASWCSLGKKRGCIEALRRSSVGRCATHGLRARPPPEPGNDDISKWHNR